MITKRKICSAIAAAFVAVSGVVNADVVTEAEKADPTKPNNPIGNAQPLIIDSSGSVTVYGVLGTDVVGAAATTDVDFYSFDAREGDVVLINIDNGIKPAGQRSVDTTIAVFGPGPVFQKLRENDDVRAADLPAGQPLVDTPGSISSADSRIFNFRPPSNGTYYVGVSSFPRHFASPGGGGVISTTLNSRSNGAYTLIISGVSPSVQQINVDIRPGNDKPAPLNPKSRGVIPVALLSSSEFDPLTVNQDSLTFGATGKESTLQRCNKDNVDLNGDGMPDLVCHFDNGASSFDEDSVEGIVMGTFGTGRRMFEGRGLLKVVPRGSKREE